MHDRGGHWVTQCSSRGHPFQVWVFAVPRIRDEFLECVVYLYPDRPAAETGRRAGGSGFIVGIPLGFSDIIQQDWVTTVVVTNSHVINNGNTAIRINAIDRGTEVFETEERHWLHHPEHDLAITPIKTLSYERHAFKFVPQISFMMPEGVEALKIGPGDECFVVGRFSSHDGRQRNTPSVRFGAIAQMPQEKIQFPDGTEQESFLVEARSIAGYSGSPVFVSIPPFDDPGVGRGNFSWRRGPWLLGVDHCHLFTEEKVRDPVTKNPLGHKWYVRSNTGMMGVIPAWRLAEMFRFPDMRSLLETEREAAEQQRAKLQEEATGERDATSSGAPDSGSPPAGVLPC
jgi:hypothetical protein